MITDIVGEVVEALPGATFWVKIEGREKPVRCYLAGKMRLNQIKVIVGDKIRLEVADDYSNGRITRRL